MEVQTNEENEDGKKKKISARHVVCKESPDWLKKAGIVLEDYQDKLFDDSGR